ncbi:MAG: FMN-binding protein [Bacteroidetes bacterium]|nr:FMN-binding protein [Bacteroidota bacterium]
MWATHFSSSIAYSRQIQTILIHSAEKSLPALSAVLILIALPNIGLSQLSMITRQEALALRFPDAIITSEQIFLTQEQVEEIERISKVEVKGKLYLRFIATKNDQVVGRSYVDTHVVRTKRESLLISLSPDGHILRIDVTAFLEPPEYVPDARWLRQYEGKTVDPSIQLSRAIQPILGATLTSRAVNSAVRRIHAMDAVLEASRFGQ